MMNDLLIPKVGSLPQAKPEGGAEKIGKGESSFDKILNGSLIPGVGVDKSAPAMGASSLKFSAHAMNRIRDRGISMDKENLAKLEAAVDSAAAKGGKESLILSKDAAFIVSVKNKTVITVLDRNAMNGNVFTNIDSTVLI
jgi:flagellar operon protein